MVPIVNENDTVAVEELRFGDNDRLAALVAGVVDARWLFLMTDVDGVYTGNPRVDPTATRIAIVPDVGALQAQLAAKAASEAEAAAASAAGEGGGGSARGGGSSWGTGGMATKLVAAQLASAAGVRTVIMHSADMRLVPDVVAGKEDRGTHCMPQSRPLSPRRTRKRWINGLKLEGVLVVDLGAGRAIANRKNLFASGIKEVEGSFPSQALVELRTEDGVVCGRGLANYSSDEIDLVKGKSSDTFMELLSYTGTECIIHRENIIVSSSDTLSDEETRDASSGVEAKAGSA